MKFIIMTYMLKQKRGVNTNILYTSELSNFNDVLTEEDYNTPLETNDYRAQNTISPI